jgi:hypothetical protein
MKKILNILVFILSFLWQLPQSLIGLFMLIYFKVMGDAQLLSYKKGCFAYKSDYMNGGISLGNFAFVSKNLAKREEAIAHEQLGHTWDSKLMGPLYLFIVGIPSLLNAAFDFTECYYDFFPERWANKHAGLEVDSGCRLKFKNN